MTGIKDMLGDEPFNPKQAHQLARDTDPSTSFEAASSVLPRLRKLQQVVYDHFVAAKQLTDLDLETRCGDHGSTYRTRRAELVELGLLRDTGQRKHQAGRNRIIWGLA